jgi:hypothetical protein
MDDAFTRHVVAMTPTGAILTNTSLPNDGRLYHFVTGPGRSPVILDRLSSFVATTDENGRVRYGPSPPAKQNSIGQAEIRPHGGAAIVGGRLLLDSGASVSVRDLYGGISVLLQATADGGAIVFTETAVGGIMTQRVYWYSSDGRLVQSYRIPLEQQRLFIPQPLDATLDGDVFILLARPEKLSVHRLSPQHSGRGIEHRHVRDMCYVPDCLLHAAVAH